jgi:hypothetical protein
MSRHPPRGGSGGNGLTDLTRRIAAAAMGVPETSLVGGFYNIGFEGETSGAFSQAGTGARVGVAQKLQLNTGTTAGSHVIVSPVAVTGATAPKILQIGAGKKWWVGGIFSLSLTPPIVAGDAGGIILHENTAGFIGHVGFNFTASAANFAVNISGGAGGSIDSGVPFDTAFRLHEFWRDGTTGNYRTNMATNLRGALGNPVQGNIRPSVISAIGAGMQITGGATDLVEVCEWIAAWVEME